MSTADRSEPPRPSETIAFAAPHARKPGDHHVVRLDQIAQCQGQQRRATGRVAQETRLMNVGGGDVDSRGANRHRQQRDGTQLAG